MTGFLAYSIYSYMASFASWRIEKIYKEQNDEQKIKIFFFVERVHYIKLLKIVYFKINSNVRNKRANKT